jgi:hypothetical protein
LAGLPRLGGPASPWRVFPAYRQTGSQIIKEKEVTGIISDNQVMFLSVIQFLIFHHFSIDLHP